MNLPQKIWVQNQPTPKCMCAAAPEVPVCICKLTQVLTKELHTSPFIKEKRMLHLKKYFNFYVCQTIRALLCASMSSTSSDKNAFMVYL